MRPEPRCLGGGDLAGKIEDALQRRQDHREVARRPRLSPDLLAGRGGARRGVDEIARHRRRMQPGSTHFTQIGTLPIVEIVLR